MLTPKQSAFVREYMVDLNATQAAIRAGYSERTANRIGAENLSKPVIQDAIREQREIVEETCRITVEWVLNQIAGIARKEDAADRDRLKALELLGKYLGLWEKRTDDETNVVRVIIENEAEGWSG